MKVAQSGGNRASQQTRWMMGWQKKCLPLQVVILGRWAGHLSNLLVLERICCDIRTALDVNKSACLLLRVNAARIYAGRAYGIFMPAAYWVILLQIHHAGNIPVAVSQTVR